MTRFAMVRFVAMAAFLLMMVIYVSFIMVGVATYASVIVRRRRRGRDLNWWLWLVISDGDGGIGVVISDGDGGIGVVSFSSSLLLLLLLLLFRCVHFTSELIGFLLHQSH
ncbi:hypothetical protein RIF29_42325 [Crotalaria pallida]|uniref:Transmembrane protein n=1 Tax=Crotalaria pallida TaxID=3830 RepID=A0AAN9HTJ1_CROPI